MEPLIGILIGLMLAYVGISDSLATWRDRRQKTLGTVKSSSLERVGESEVYKLTLSYSYRVNGVPFENSLIDMRVLKPQGAEKMAASYAPGATVDVFYLPTDHKSSVVEYKVDLARSVLFALAGVGVIIVVFVLDEMDII